MFYIFGRFVCLLVFKKKNICCEIFTTDPKVSHCHNIFTFSICCLSVLFIASRVAQWKRAGPITQRSEDQNLALLDVLFHFFFNFCYIEIYENFAGQIFCGLYPSTEEVILKVNDLSRV